MEFKCLLCGSVSLVSVCAAAAGLEVKVAVPKSTGDKAVIKVEMKNAFAERIESARAVVFLIDDNGKVVGQMTRWVIGGEKDRPALLPNTGATYSFVVPTEKKFATTKLNFTRVVLNGGKLADVTKGVIVTSATK